MFDLLPRRGKEGGRLAIFRSELDSLFNRFFDMDRPFSQSLFKKDDWEPRVNVSEGEKKITIEAEIPGCDAQDIEISLEGRILTIKGEKKQEKEEKDQNYLRVERAHGLFTRSMELPAEVDQNEVEARYKKGVLIVVLHKTTPKESRKIEIKT